MMTCNDRKFISTCIQAIVWRMQRDHPRMTPGEVYGAIAQELERRCLAAIDPQKQEQLDPARSSGLGEKGEPS